MEEAMSDIPIRIASISANNNNNNNNNRIEEEARHTE
jgi:hypothetical protein